MSVEIVTFGCRLNAYESEVMRGLAHAAPTGAADTVIVNTCAVTAEAERQARQAIRRLARERPEARIVVTGCAAQIDPAAWSALPNVHRVLGNAEKLHPESWTADTGSLVGDIMAPRVAARRLVAQVPELPRLRLSSIDPAAIDADLWRLIEDEPRLMPHLHLSLQAGSDMILKRMKRRHSAAEAAHAIRRARAARPGIAIG